MKIITCKAHNIKRLTDIDVSLEGRHLYRVCGQNNSGKTSFTDSVRAVLCGRSGMDDYPDPLLREGEKEGWINVKLSGDAELHEDSHLTVQLELTRRRDGSVKETFRILDSAGDECPEPRKTIQRLYQAKAFDPLSFDRLGRKERRAVLSKLVGVDLDEYSKARAHIYNDRKAINRDITKAAGRVEAAAHHKDAPTARVVVDELLEELESIRKHNEREKEAAKQMHAAIATQNDASNAVEEAQAALDRAKAAEKQAIAAASQAIKDREAIGDPKDATEVSAKIKDAGATNEKVAENERREDLVNERDELERQADALTEKIEDLDEEIDGKLQAANWPVDGLSMDEEGVILDGLPFESASTSRRIVVSAKVGMALNPKLKLFISNDGSALDLDTMTELDKILAEEDYQMIVEIVSRSEADEKMCALVIEDGHEKGLGE